MKVSLRMRSDAVIVNLRDISRRVDFVERMECGNKDIQRLCPFVVHVLLLGVEEELSA